MRGSNMSSTIRDRQIAALKCMLNLGKVATKKSAIEPEWKVLIYDQHGQDIISPLLSVAELRDLGITLYLPLESARDAISDVTAVYFVVPNDENISRICQDMKDKLYDNYHFNFISAISRTKLEDVATAALQSDADTQMIKIFDQYINFVTLEKDLFVIKGKGDRLSSYHNLNKSDLKDYEMMSIIDSMVDSLYCVFVSMGAMPIIRCPPGNAAEMVAEKLDKRFRDNLRDARNSFFSSMPGSVGDHGQQFSTFQRPLLLILDRNVDLATPLHHTWTYQSLVHDVMDFNLNSVTIVEESGAASTSQSRKKTQVFSLGQNDKFWQQYKGNPFPEVAQAVQEEIEEYKGHEEEVQRLKSAMGLSDTDSGPVDISDNTAKLTSAMSSLPELLEKKRLIDMHTTIATAVLGSIKERKLDEYFEMEEKIMNKSASEKALLDLINDPVGGTPEDKMRMFLIYFLCQATNETNLDQFTQALEGAGCDMSPIKYIKRWRQYSMPSTSSQQQYRGGGTKTVNMFSHLMSTGSQFVMEGVKNLVIKKHNLPVTKILDSLMELKNSSETEKYRYFDPKILRSVDSGAGRTKLPYSDAVVFVVGGGNYIEYHNLMEYSKSKTGKRISYGCSELANASQFLRQLSLLGKELE
uniref:Sec1 family domain-containing protein 1 n=1 Tax=Phallusia mammillata TaxID=59560 RepID=A0A6F9DRU0_9ASCI|nr:sec1 family domain-containing protein 1 [Phallusia mammillata]